MDADDYAKTLPSGVFEVVDSDGDVVFTAPQITVGANGGILSVTVTETGSLESSDHAILSYSIDGGAATTLEVNDDFTSQTWTETITAGSSTLDVTVSLKCNNNAEAIQLVTLNYTDNVILDVSLSGFEGKLLNDQVELDWTTDSESSNAFFAVERDNGFGFTEIGRVDAYGDGNSHTRQSYKFIDRSPLIGINNYRLRIVDQFGDVKFSWIETVNLPVSGFEVFPNPTSDVLMVTWQGHDETIEVFGASRNFIGKHLVTEGVNQIDVSGLNPGYYYIATTKGTAVFIKQ